MFGFCQLQKLNYLCFHYIILLGDEIEGVQSYNKGNFFNITFHQ